MMPAITVGMTMIAGMMVIAGMTGMVEVVTLHIASDRVAGYISVARLTGVACEVVRRGDLNPSARLDV